MKRVEIDGERLKDWDSFHKYFKEKFGFPDYYGANMNAWIDCMTYLDDPDSGMTSKVFVAKKQVVVLDIRNVETLILERKELYDALIECSSFVNYRRIESGEAPILVLSFNKNN